MNNTEIDVETYKVPKNLQILYMLTGKPPLNLDNF